MLEKTERTNNEKWTKQKRGQNVVQDTEERQTKKQKTKNKAKQKKNPKESKKNPHNK